jgi:DhnA family fructose-bisphosphate aldolase class Ia
VSYSIGQYRFDLEAFFPGSIKDAITEIRVNNPEVVMIEARARTRRQKLTHDGKLTILAADHPGRRVTGSGLDPLVMGDRIQYLGRVLRVLIAGEVDGIMGTTDIIEELFIVNHLVKQKGGPDFLSKKVMVGCMNRGGLSGATFEMDDRLTSFTAERIHHLELDAAKTMFRLEDTEEQSLQTIEYNVQAINQLNQYGIPVFVEPLPVKKEDGKYKVQKKAEPLIKTIGVASALGNSSMNLWLKIPYCEGYDRVVRATTLPLLMLGGESSGDPTGIIQDFANGMTAGKNVRGALVGRNVTFPGNDDPRAVASAIHGVVHKGWRAAQAVEHLLQVRGQEMNALCQYFK